MDRDQAKPDGAATLDEALAHMSFTVEPGSFALAGFPEAADAADLALLAPPALLVREADGTTLLVRDGAADEVLGRHPDARFERDLAWIRFDALMGWEVVGFLARVTGALAAAGVPLGCVCGFDRDHLFVARRYLERTCETLNELFPEA